MMKQKNQFGLAIFVIDLAGGDKTTQAKDIKTALHLVRHLSE
jgi:putative component of toxin-antitoxin plasmid stabilization module